MTITPRRSDRLAAASPLFERYRLDRATTEPSTVRARIDFSHQYPREQPVTTTEDESGRLTSVAFQGLERVADAADDSTPIVAVPDCGFGTQAGLGMVHPEIAWAKLEALVKGAEIATERIY